MAHQDKAAARMESAESGIDTRKKESGPASIGDVDRWLKEVETERLAADGKGGYLVTESDGTKHLPTTKNGKPDHGLMGGAWAALHGGYRGKEYSGPNKQQAISKLKALYKREGLKTPDEKEAASAILQIAPKLVSVARTILETFSLVEPAKVSFRKEEPEILTSTFTVVLSGDEAPPWIEVLPAGKFAAVDGRGPFENDEPEQVIAASISKMPQVGLVLDYDHSTDLAAPEGRPAPAAGWIKGFKVQQGAILANIEWTDDAAEAIKAKKYRYVSPVFEHDKEGKVERILRAALTNNPALIQLPALASARVKMAKKKDEMSLRDMMDRFPQKDEEDMGAYHARIGRHIEAETAGALTNWAEQEEKEHGMDGDDSQGGADMAAEPADAAPYEDETEEQMSKRHEEEMSKCANDEEASACKMRHQEEASRMSKRKEEAARMSREAESGADKKGDEGEAMQARMAQPGIKPMSKAQFELAVAKHPMVLAMQAEFNKLRAERAKDEAVKKVDGAIREGRLIPAQRDWAIAYCTGDSKGFDTFIGSQPKIVEKGEDGTFKGIIGDRRPGPGGLSKREVDIFANMGIESEEQLTKCAAIKEKWELRFSRPTLNLDDTGNGRISSAEDNR